MNNTDHLDATCRKLDYKKVKISLPLQATRGFYLIKAKQQYHPNTKTSVLSW